MYRQPVKPQPDVISLREVYELSKLLKHPEDVALYYIIYLSGCRVSEALELRGMDIELAISGDTGLLLFRNMPTRKNRKFKFRDIPVVINSPEEKKMAEFIYAYLKQFHPEKKVFEKLKQTTLKERFSRAIKVDTFAQINSGKGSAKRDRYRFGLYPHYLRHCRATHLSEWYDIPPFQFLNLFGWTDLRPASTYVRRNIGQVVSAMIHKKKLSEYVNADESKGNNNRNDSKESIKDTACDSKLVKDESNQVPKDNKNDKIPPERKAADAKDDGQDNK